MLATVAVVQAGPSGLSASSHREAPAIAGDPRGDNTDVYAFVSADAPDAVNLIASWIPFEEPNGGPNFYPWGDGNVDDTTGYRYLINIDNDGDAVADLIYEWTFTTIIKDDSTFIYNTGPFSSVNDDTLNYYQTYDLAVIDGAGDRTVLLDDAIAAPSIAGAASTPDYDALVAEAVASGTVGDLKSFAGQSDDPFFLDLRVFDLLYGGDLSENNEDTLAGYNVNTIALQVPQSEVALNNDAAGNPVIGVWSTTERAMTTDDGAGNAVTEYTQISRLGNPLVNEVVIPLALKDAFNSIPPSADATIPAAVDAVQNPILPPLVEAVYGIPAPEGDRSDLVEVFLQGVSVANTGLAASDENPALAADLNSLGLNADVNSITPSEMLRLNMAVPAAADPQPLGVLQGDFQGFPNGRRLTDDVVNAAILVAEGVVFGPDTLDPTFAALLQAEADAVSRNDRDFKSEFPYVANPHLDSVNNGPERTPRAPEFVQVEGDRALDTRDGQQLGYDGAKPAAGQKITVDLSSSVPTDAQAAFVTVTSVDSESNGFVTVYESCDDDLPNVASLNPLASAPVSNLVAAPVADDGTICIYTSTATNLVVDVTGFEPSTAAYVPFEDPQRILETRAGSETGQIGYSGDSPQRDDIVTVDVISPTGLAADTKAVVLNITSINAERTGFITAYPCDADSVPTAANVNFVASQVRGNLSVVEVSADGTVCLYTDSDTDITVDIQGAYPATSEFVSVVPERIYDTRPGSQRTNYTGDKLTAGEIVAIQVWGVGNVDVPAGAGTVFLNLAAVQAETRGYLVAFPCGQAFDPSDSENHGFATVGVYSNVANTSSLVAAEVGDGGQVCVYTSAPINLTADVFGYFPETQLVGS